MERLLLLQLFCLGLYVFFVAFSFCDGFKLNIVSKIIWNIAFLAVCIFALNTRGKLYLEAILPFPTVFAILLCAFEKARQKMKEQTK